MRRLSTIPLEATFGLAARLRESAERRLALALEMQGLWRDLNDLGCRSDRRRRTGDRLPG